MPIGQIDRTQSYASGATATFDAGLRHYMLSIYNYMTTSLAITGLVAWIVGATPALTHALYGSRLSMTLVAFAPLLVMLVLFNGPGAMRASALQLKTRLFVFSAVMGLSLGFIFLVYSHSAIARAFFITAGTFGGMSLWGYSTRRDLTGMGHFMMMGLWGLILASIISIFMRSSELQLMISLLSVIIFTGLTAWQTQALKETYSANYGMEANDKMAVQGALSLYISFINLFMSILRLTGGNYRD